MSDLQLHRPSKQRFRDVIPGRGSRRHPRLAGLLVFAFVGTVVIYYLLARRAWGGNSDAATLVLQGESIAQGHVTLHGWSFLLDSFWTVDVPLYVLGYLVLGMNPALVFWVPAIVAAVVLSVGIYLGFSGRPRRAGWVSALVLIGLIGLPTGSWIWVFLSVYGHSVTILMCLFAFIALRSGRFGIGWAMAVAVLALGLVGDLQALPIGVGPIAAAGALAMLRTRSIRGGAPNVAAAMAAPVLAYLLRRMALLLGTYQIGQANPHASKAVLIDNAYRLPGYLARVFGYTGAGGGWRTGMLSVSSPLGWVRIAAVVVVALAVVLGIMLTIHGIWSALDRRRDTNTSRVASADWRIDDILILGALVDLAFFLYATLADDITYLRYLSPFVIFGSIYTARLAGKVASMPRTAPYARGMSVTLGAVVAVFATACLPAIAFNPVPYTNSDLATSLAARGLSVGIGDFWTASQTTLASAGKVVIRPVQGSGDRVIRRFQLSQDIWYRTPFQFLACPASGSFEGLSCDVATATFGQPAQRFRVADEDILVWSHPISVHP
jgi:hypothetical protein